MGGVRRVSLQHLVLRDKALRALGKKHFVTELERRSHLAAHDQVSVGLEDGIDLLGICHLLSVKYPAARLIDYTLPQATIMFDLLAEARDRQVGKRVFAARLAGVELEAAAGAPDRSMRGLKNPKSGRRGLLPRAA